jgi:hypothetical protein
MHSELLEDCGSGGSLTKGGSYLGFQLGRNFGFPLAFGVLGAAEVVAGAEAGFHQFHGSATLWARLGDRDIGDGGSSGGFFLAGRWKEVFEFFAEFCREGFRIPAFRVSATGEEGAAPGGFDHHGATTLITGDARIGRLDRLPLFVGIGTESALGIRALYIPLAGFAGFEQQAMLTAAGAGGW